MSFVHWPQPSGGNPLLNKGEFTNKFTSTRSQLANSLSRRTGIKLQPWLLASVSGRRWPPLDTLANRHRIGFVDVEGRNCRRYRNRQYGGYFCRRPTKSNVAGWSSPVAREAHNLEVAGSNPVPATYQALAVALSTARAFFVCWRYSALILSPRAPFSYANNSLGDNLSPKKSCKPFLRIARRHLMLGTIMGIRCGRDSPQLHSRLHRRHGLGRLFLLR